MQTKNDAMSELWRVLSEKLGGLTPDRAAA